MVGFFAADVLHVSQAARIAEHKYKSSGHSLCEFILQPFWNWSAPYIPKTIAPNLLTAGGLIANLVPVVVILFYSPTLKEQIPALPVILLAIGCFIYQTLDALDGLHARRTNTCSPLGELFDHGCDAISMYILSIAYLAIIGMGYSPAAMLTEFFLLNSFFYISQWQAYVTGTMTFSWFSVTEALLILILFCFVSAALGVNLWLTQDPIFGLPLNLAQFIIVVIGSFVLFSQILHTISVGGVGKYGTTVANTSVLFPICPLLLVIGSALLVTSWSSTHVFHQHPCLFLMCFGAVIAKVSQNLVIAHMTKSSLSLFDTVMLGPGLLLTNSYFDCPLNEHFLLWIACIWSTFDMLYFCVRVCIQLANFLNIHMFRIVERPQRKRSSIGQRSTTPVAADGVSNHPNISAASLRSRTRK